MAGPKWFCDAFGFAELDSFDETRAAFTLEEQPSSLPPWLSEAAELVLRTDLGDARSFIVGPFETPSVRSHHSIPLHPICRLTLHARCIHGPCLTASNTDPRSGTTALSTQLKLACLIGVSSKRSACTVGSSMHDITRLMRSLLVHTAQPSRGAGRGAARETPASGRGGDRRPGQVPLLFIPQEQNSQPRGLDPPRMTDSGSCAARELTLSRLAGLFFETGSGRRAQ